MTTVYFLKPVGADGPIKIGCSIHPEGRLLSFAAWSPVPLEIIARLPGDVVLEQRLHARFLPHHSHGEWFKPCPELLALVVSVQDGTFDEAELPEPKRIRSLKTAPPESRAAMGMALRLNAMQRRGVRIPPEVYEARHTYQCSPEEVARRRAIVRNFVEGWAA